MGFSNNVIYRTWSVCPECLAKIPAAHVMVNGDVHLQKTCAQHGDFSTVIWRGKEKPFYDLWCKPKVRSFPQVCMTETEKGCPYDCGLCPEHRQQTCCVLLEVTQRCNLQCRFCFAESGGNGLDPSLAQIREWLEILASVGKPFIHLSGGEPTLREDLPEIVEMAKQMGFSYIQLNTNGLRLGREPELAKKLKEAGLSSVFMQFDGTCDEIYQELRGKSLLMEKEKAIEHCAASRLGVVLVATLVPGINDRNIGDIIRFGLDKAPIVRGVHFQPVSYFGNDPEVPSDCQRITLPEVIREIERQTAGLFSVDHFSPSGCDHARCGFHGDFVLMPEGKIQSLTHKNTDACCCTKDSNSSAMQKNRNFVARRWELKDEETISQSMKKDIGMGEWDTFVKRIKTHGFTVTGMAFQDCWNLDLERLKECSLHVFSPEGRVIPFCIYYLKGRTGKTLYKGAFSND